MKPFFATVAALLALAFQFHAAPARAAESYDACTNTISTLPVTISTPGIWCMRQNLAFAPPSGNAITITTNDVTVDCNGFKLDGSASYTSTGAKGIRADGRSGITVRNCAIRGFYYGIALLGAGAFLAILMISIAHLD